MRKNRTKDFAVYFIGVKKVTYANGFEEGNTAVCTQDLWQALSEIAVKGGKGANSKHFTLYHEIDVRCHQQI